MRDECQFCVDIATLICLLTFSWVVKVVDRQWLVISWSLTRVRHDPQMCVSRQFDRLDRLIGQPPRDDHVVTQENREAATAAIVEGALAVSNLAELHGRSKPCFRRAEPFRQAEKYVAALVSDLPRKNGWTIAEHYWR
jgi:hypothetical protein